MQRAAAVASLALAVAAAAQRPARPELTLEVQAKDPLDGIPQRIRLTLRNMTEHDMRLPEPGIACNSAYGSLWLRVTLQGKAVHQPETSCLPQSGNENPRTWVTLGPGGYLDRWYSARQLHLTEAGLGRYSLQGEYHPPALSPILTRSLTEEGIQFPHSSARSNHLEFKR